MYFFNDPRKTQDLMPKIPFFCYFGGGPPLFEVSQNFGGSVQLFGPKCFG
jgi:hypothetical protein